MNRILLLAALAAAGNMVIGCASSQKRVALPPSAQYAPRETSKSVLSEYTIGTSDVLSVEVVHLVPKSPYLLKIFDVVSINATGVDPDFPINDKFQIQPGGSVMLPAHYGSVQIAGVTSEEAGRIIAEKIGERFSENARAMLNVTVGLYSVSGLQEIAGEHMVGSDGRINLGIYGSVDVFGLTIPEAREAIEFQLANYLESPQVAVDIFAYNSKSYYIVMQGAGYGDKTRRLPYTGNETVLDAICEINGLERVSSKRIWIARPQPNCNEIVQLPIDWDAITACGNPQTNYQLLPNDRVYIAEDKLVALDTGLSKIIAPFERVMGFSLLGAQTVTRFSGSVLKGGGDPSGGRGQY
ncbi:MAG: polysaccharide biosynthesis/export family protein [Planctomycetaceae bacterium]|nr:polysaccharide biosynthesis/export family protein [Planctomycetaceae bacterium]